MGKRKTPSSKFKMGMLGCVDCKQERYAKIYYGRKLPIRCLSCSRKATKYLLHGEYGTPLHRKFQGMHARCVQTSALPCYIGKSVCREWKERGVGYLNFKAWALANGYRDELSLDRIDNSKGYSPDNCRWVTDLEQQRNRTSVKLTMELANKIRETYALGGISHVGLGKMFGVTPSNIYMVTNNRIWTKE
jgi:hypothetical protein